MLSLFPYFGFPRFQATCLPSHKEGTLYTVPTPPISDVTHNPHSQCTEAALKSLPSNPSRKDLKPFGEDANKVPQNERQPAPYKNKEEFYCHVKEKIPKIAKDTTDRIFDQVTSQTDDLFRKVQEQKEKEHLLCPSQKGKYARSLLVTQDKKIFVLFNKLHKNNPAAKHQDRLIGEGGSKAVKLALDFYQGEWSASASMKKTHWIKELKNFKLVEKVPGALKLKYWIEYKSKRDPDVTKVRFLTEYYPTNLDNVIAAIQKAPGTYPLENKKKLIIQILKKVIDFHKNDLIHRDISPNNILVGHRKVCLMDYGSLCKDKDQDDPGNLITTCWGAPPEYALAFKNKRKFPPTKALDIWSVACLIYEILEDKLPPWCCSKDEAKVMEEILTTFQNGAPVFYSEPSEKNSLQYLLSRMFIVDPHERITAQDLAKAIEEDEKKIKELIVLPPKSGITPSLSAGAEVVKKST